MEFKFHFHFSFSHDIEKRIWTSYFVFRFRTTLKNGSEFRFDFVFHFRITLKTDLNFVFRSRITLKNGFEFRFSFLYGLLLKNRSEFRLSFFHDLKNGLLHRSSHLKSPDIPSRLTGAFTFYASVSKWIFLSPGPKWVMNSSRPHGTPFFNIEMDDKWYDDSREKTRSYRNTCIPSMEKENDEYTETLQLEVTKCEITKIYKWSFTVFRSFCRMTQSLQGVFLVVISRIQQITTS